MKLFIVSKIYDTEKQSTAEIEESVLKDLDCYVGKDNVIFKLYKIGKTAAMYFYRRLKYSDYHSDSKNLIMDADAYMITGEYYNGFRMPVQFPKVPYGYSYYMEQTEFLKAYIGSAEVLGADKIKKAWLEVDKEKIVLKV